MSHRLSRNLPLYSSCGYFTGLYTGTDFTVYHIGIMSASFNFPKTKNHPRQSVTPETCRSWRHRIPIIGRNKWQNHHESASRPQAAFHFDTPAMGLDNGLADSEPQAGPLDARGPWRPIILEENPGMVFCRHTYSGVGNRYLDGVFGCLGHYMDFPVGQGIFNGISYQIIKNPGKLSGIGPHLRKPIFFLKKQFYPLLLGISLVVTETDLKDVADVHTLPVKIQKPHIKSVIVKHLLYH